MLFLAQLGFVSLKTYSLLSSPPNLFKHFLFGKYNYEVFSILYYFCHGNYNLHTQLKYTNLYYFII